MARKRDITLQRMPEMLSDAAKAKVNRGMPFGNRTLSEMEARELGLAGDLRRGAVAMRVFREDA